MRAVLWPDGQTRQMAQLGLTELACELQSMMVAPPEDIGAQARTMKAALTDSLSWAGASEADVAMALRCLPSVASDAVFVPLVHAMLGIATPTAEAPEGGG